jgi:hypothetical protein
MRTLWINIAMSDSSSFHVTLAHASSLFAGGVNENPTETTESLQHYTASVQDVSKRLLDPVENTSDSIIGTILGFSCLDVRKYTIYKIILELIEFIDYLSQLG